MASLTGGKAEFHRKVDCAAHQVQIEITSEGEVLGLEAIEGRDGPIVERQVYHARKCIGICVARIENLKLRRWQRLSYELLDCPGKCADKCWEELRLLRAISRWGQVSGYDGHRTAILGGELRCGVSGVEGKSRPVIRKVPPLYF